MQGSPKLKVAIIGCGLAGLSTAVELVDQGHEVCDARPVAPQVLHLQGSMHQ